MSTSNNDQKSAKSQHHRSDSVKKSGKGSGRYNEDEQNTAPVNRAKTEQKRPGNDAQTFSDKISSSGPSDELAKPRKSNQKVDDDED